MLRSQTRYLRLVFTDAAVLLENVQLLRASLLLPCSCLLPMSTVKRYKDTSALTDSEAMLEDYRGTTASSLAGMVGLMFL